MRSVREDLWRSSGLVRRGARGGAKAADLFSGVPCRGSADGFRSGTISSEASEAAVEPVNDEESPIEMAERLLIEAEAERMRKMAKEKPPVVPRDDLNPKIKAGGQAYVAVVLAGVLAAAGAAQQNLQLSPFATLGLSALVGIIPLIRGYLKAGDGR